MTKWERKARARKKELTKTRALCGQLMVDRNEWRELALKYRERLIAAGLMKKNEA